MFCANVRSALFALGVGAAKIKTNSQQMNYRPIIKHIVSLTFAVIAVAVTTAGVFAGEAKPFNQEAFTKAKAEGKTVLVDFHASWCSVCKKQAMAIPQVLKKEKFKDVIVLSVDYDTEKELKEELKVSGQSTLIVFKGEKEVGREQGITSPTAIETLLSKGL